MSSVPPHQDLVDKEPRYIENRDMRGWESVIGQFFYDFVFGQMVPSDGSIVELGTGQGVNFLELCRQFGEERCVGYDVVNFLKHPRVKEEDIRKLSPKDDYPIALGFNDLSDWELSPQSKQSGFEFIKRNLVTGGYYIDAAFTDQTCKLIDLSEFTLIAERDSVKLFKYNGEAQGNLLERNPAWELPTSFWQWLDRLQMKEEQSLRLRNSSREPLLSDENIRSFQEWNLQDPESPLAEEELVRRLPHFTSTVSQFVAGFLQKGKSTQGLRYWIRSRSSSSTPCSFRGPTFAFPMGRGSHVVSVWNRHQSGPAPAHEWELQETDVLFFPEGSSIDWKSEQPQAPILLVELDIDEWEEAIQTGIEAIEKTQQRLSFVANYTKSLKSCSPDIYESIHRSCPLITSVTKGFEDRITLPESIRSTQDPSFERYREHYRSWTLPLHKIGKIKSPQGVVVIKGSEPLLNDYNALLEWMTYSTFRGPSNFGHSPMLEHFPLHENKIPGALSLREAESEFRIACDIQHAHLKHYGELARMPIPLGVHQIERTESQKVHKLLEQRISQQAMGNISHLLTEGLGIYLYYYPGTPHRVRTAARPFQGESESSRIERLQEWNPGRIIRKWCTLFARIIHLGYLPYSFHNETLGAIFDSGNACMDGGFVDLDSLIPITQIKTDDAFFDALAGSLLGLIRTVSELLPHLCHGETKEFFVRQYVMDEIRQALLREATQTLQLDTRVSRLFGPLSFEDLMTQLQTRQRHTSDFMTSIT